MLILYRKGEKFCGFPCASGARERSLRDAKCFLPNTSAARFSSESHVVTTSSGEPVSRATMLSHFGKIAKENRLNVLRRMDRTSSIDESQNDFHNRCLWGGKKKNLLAGAGQSLDNTLIELLVSFSLGSESMHAKNKNKTARPRTSRRSMH